MLTMLGLGWMTPYLITFAMFFFPFVGFFALLLVFTPILWFIHLILGRRFDPVSFFISSIDGFFQEFPLVAVGTIIFYTLAYGAFLFYQLLVNGMEIPFMPYSMWAFGILFSLVSYFALTIFFPGGYVKLFYLAFFLIVFWAKIWEFLTMVWNFSIMLIISIGGLVVSMIVTQNWLGLAVSGLIAFWILAALKSLLKG